MTRRYGRSPAQEALRALHELSELERCFQSLRIARHESLSIAIPLSGMLRPQTLCLLCGKLAVLNLSNETPMPVGVSKRRSNTSIVQEALRNLSKLQGREEALRNLSKRQPRSPK